jgi:hypothetical protein
LPKSWIPKSDTKIFTAKWQKWQKWQKSLDPNFDTKLLNPSFDRKWQKFFYPNFDNKMEKILGS